MNQDSWFLSGKSMAGLSALLHVHALLLKFKPGIIKDFDFTVSLLLTSTGLQPENFTATIPNLTRCLHVPVEGIPSVS